MVNEARGLQLGDVTVRIGARDAISYLETHSSRSTLAKGSIDAFYSVLSVLWLAFARVGNDLALGGA